jgi:hypothetical protein
LLALPPTLWVLGFDDLCGGGQVFADVVEVQQVAALLSKVFLELVHDPRCAIAHAVDAGAVSQSGRLRGGPP